MEPVGTKSSSNSIPNHKADTNKHSPFSTGINYHYSDSSYTMDSPACDATSPPRAMSKSKKQPRAKLLLCEPGFYSHHTANLTARAIIP
ncbi:MAG: hypothetical protein ACI9NQ_001066 [Paracoccaceae bacterium]|jgi:hypothetical protein